MAQFEFPLLVLMNEVAAQMAAAGVAVDHVFGVAEKSAHGRPPRYVWVPTRSRDRNATPVRAVDELRSIFASQEHCEVYCFGQNFHQAWALRQNLLKCLNDAAAADIEIESGRWERPAGALNQDGELYVLEFSMNVPVVDGYVPPTTLLEPVASTFIPARIEADIQLSASVDENGEALTTVSS